MNCRNCERWIVLDLEGGLTSGQKTVLEEHLKGCAGCRKAADDYRAVRNLLAALPPAPVPVLPAFGRLLPEKKKTTAWFLRRTFLAPAALAVCFFLAAGIVRFRSLPLFVDSGQNGSGADVLSGISEKEFLAANFSYPADYHYFLKNLSTEEQEVFFSELSDVQITLKGR